MDVVERHFGVLTEALDRPAVAVAVRSDSAETEAFRLDAVPRDAFEAQGRGVWSLYAARERALVVSFATSEVGPPEVAMEIFHAADADVASFVGSVFRRASGPFARMCELTRLGSAARKPVDLEGGLDRDDETWSVRFFVRADARWRSAAMAAFDAIARMMEFPRSEPVVLDHRALGDGGQVVVVQGVHARLVGNERVVVVLGDEQVVLMMTAGRRELNLRSVATYVLYGIGDEVRDLRRRLGDSLDRSQARYPVRMSAGESGTHRLFYAWCAHSELREHVARILNAACRLIDEDGAWLMYDAPEI